MQGGFFFLWHVVVRLYCNNLLMIIHGNKHSVMGDDNDHKALVQPKAYKPSIRDALFKVEWKAPTHFTGQGHLTTLQGPATPLLQANSNNNPAGSPHEHSQPVLNSEPSVSNVNPPHETPSPLHQTTPTLTTLVNARPASTAKSLIQLSQQPQVWWSLSQNCYF